MAFKEWPLFLREDKRTQAHSNATKHMIKYSMNRYTAMAGSVCLRQLSNPKISVLG